jgi:hypothetical protein
MKKISSVICAILILVSFVILVSALIRAQNYYSLNLEKGKNYVKLERSLYVKDLIKLNPEIDYVAYYDEFLNKSVSYVNAFNGVGSNFIIEQEKIYEISVRKEFALTIPVD